MMLKKLLVGLIIFGQGEVNATPLSAPESLQTPTVIEPPAATPVANENNKLVFTVKALKNDTGFVRCALYHKEENFLSTEKALANVSAKISNKQATCEFAKVPAGEYALGAFHDENANNILDTNWIGIPKEGISVSNDAKGSFGPPKYKDAKFSFKGGTQTMTINTVYL